MNTFETDLFKKKSYREKILYILYEYPSLSALEIAQYIKCYAVTSVTSVTGNKDNKSNKGNDVTENEKAKTRNYLLRLKEELTDFKEDNIKKYKLTDLTRLNIKNTLLEYEQELKREKEIIEQQEAVSRIPKDWDEYLNNIRGKDNHSLINNFNPSKDKTFPIDFKDLATYNPDLAEHFIDEPEDTLKIIQNILDTFNIDKPIIINNYTGNKNISKLNVKDMGKLVRITGEVIAKSEHHDHLTTENYECPSCGQIIKVTYPKVGTRKPPKICSCGKKGGMKPRQKFFVDGVKLTIQDIWEILDPGENPEKLNILLHGSQFPFSKLSIGEKVSITGYYVPINDKGNVDYQRVFIGLNLEKLSIDHLERNTTEQDLEEFEIIKKSTIQIF